MALSDFGFWGVNLDIDLDFLVFIARDVKLVDSFEDKSRKFTTYIRRDTSSALIAVQN